MRESSRPVEKFYDADACGRLVRDMLRYAGFGPVTVVSARRPLLLRAFLAAGVDAVGIALTPEALACVDQFAPGRLVAGSLVNLPGDLRAARLVVVEEGLETLVDEEIAAVLDGLRRLTFDTLLLRVQRWPESGNPRTRHFWEQAFFAAAFRKHLHYYDINPYESLNEESQVFQIPLQLVPERAAREHSLDLLLESRPLHMDMLRESGPRSDAHVYRYHLAAQYCRPGDVVLDAACGLGYGTALLNRVGKPAKVIGLDSSQFAIEYAKEHFGREASHGEFILGELPNLSQFADNSVDYVVSFETLEHLREPNLFLQEIFRILRPTGRVMVSVPNLWVDETGVDPNPFHYHVYSWQRLSDELSRYFDLEMLYAQDAGSGFKNPGAHRRCRSFFLTGSAESFLEAPDSEWCLGVGFLSPERKPFVPFEDRIYRYSSPPDNLLQFKRDYDNAWTVRSLVEVPFRLKSTAALEQASSRVLNAARPGSSDRGAALCVSGYRLLNGGGLTFAATSRFLEAIEHYLVNADDTPHAYRWRVSLLYVGAELCGRVGDFARSEDLLKRCVESDVLRFSPLLATKTIRAARHLAVRALGRGAVEESRHWFLRGAAEFERVMSASPEEYLGRREEPLVCTHFDLLDLVDQGMFCAVALSWLVRAEDEGSLPREIEQGSLLERMEQDRRLLFSIAEERLQDLSSLRSDYDALYQTAEERLSAMKRLSSDTEDLYSRAEERLAEIRRVGAERDELYQTAEERLREIERVGAERDDLFKVAEERLREIERVGVERDDLFKVAEERLREIERVGVERDDLYKAAEERLHEIRRVGAERDELYRTAEERLRAINRVRAERDELYRMAEDRLREIERIGTERHELFQTAEARLEELRQLVEIADARACEIDRLREENTRLASLINTKLEK